MTDPVTTPILYNTTPTPDQIAAALRYGVTALGSMAGALGYSGVFSDDRVNMITAMVGPAAAAIAFIWGQLATRAHAKKLAVAGAAAPNSVAQAKT